MKYNHELVNQLHCKQPANVESNNALYKQLLNGDLQARDDLITSNVPLVFAIVERYLVLRTDRNSIREDIISDGLVGLITAVDRLSEGTQDARININPTSFISQAIRRQIRRTLTNTRIYVTTDKITSSHYDNQIFEVAEEIGACCATEWEIEIIRLVGIGYSERAIASLMHTSRGSVEYSLQNIRNNYNIRSSQG